MGAFEEAIGSFAFRKLRACVEASGEPCEGNIMHTWNSWDPQPDMEAKQRNLFQLSQNLSARRDDPSLLEIGFNAGHSVCLMLLANPKVKVVAFDLCEHAYTKPCAEVLQSIFGQGRLQLVEGSSTTTLPRYHQQHPDVRFDMFHIDGGHQYRQAMADLESCCRMAHKDPETTSILVLDDTDITGVAAAWADFVASGRLVERAPPHKLGRYKHGVGEVIPDGASRCGSCSSCGAVWACGGCGQVRYCDESCGRSHWSLHRSVCSSRARPAPILMHPSEIVPSSMLASRSDGVLLATKTLCVGDVLFAEPPLSWQPMPDMRGKLCTRCGSGGALLRCTTCQQANYCPRCSDIAPSPCSMCPELSITKGHVGAFTLVGLEVLREWEEGRLQPGALLKPLSDAAVQQARACTPAVQKVAHFCSAVRWSDERAEEILAAVIAGRIEHVAAGKPVGVGYYPAFGRLRAGATPTEEANVRLQISMGSKHAFTVKAVVSQPVPEGAVLRLG
ncbi:Mfsd6 [Symbiodinium natans]|uniref:Mfsd6 protein n=1 Tax=Symbiodinium natans TaxID=878477 RepID=A0A812NSJ3_9DINO|nr:Mfsd6 [Symbiodinium natans]